MNAKRQNLLFTAHKDIRSSKMADEQLLVYDLLTNAAHSEMLFQVGIISEQEKNDIHQGLGKLFRLYQQGQWKLEADLEDVHFNIEHALKENFAIPAATKLHTARSRNDQSATDLALYTKHQLLIYAASLERLIVFLLELAQKNTGTTMPGFTHYQPAMYTTFGHVVVSWASPLIRQYQKLADQLLIYDLSPLGAAAGFGTAWPIDRQKTAELLGFRAPILNSLDAVVSRLEIAAEAAFLLNQVSLSLSSVAQDLILYSQPYYGFLSLGDDFVTHSSIMPQKKNLDFAEILRAKASYLQGQLMALLSIGKGQPTGYNRDYQYSKYLIQDIFYESLPVPDFLVLALSSLKLHKEEALRKCQIGAMNGVDLVDWLATHCQLGFRDAYHLVQKVLYQYDDPAVWQEKLTAALAAYGKQLRFSDEVWQQLQDPVFLVSQRKSLGSPEPDDVEASIAKLKAALDRPRTTIEGLQRSTYRAWDELFQKLSIDYSW